MIGGAVEREWWERTEEHFSRLLGLEPAERAAALEEMATHDSRLAGEIAALLTAHESEGAIDRLGRSLGLEPLLTATRGEMAGRTVGPYEIGELAEHGGMGAIYRARDSRLERDVALKFVPRWLVGDAAAQRRFRAEARTIAQLDHPNVCTLYEIGESDDGAIFLVMPFYRGETLRARLGRGRMTTAEAIGIAQQVAHGLAAAHARGIVHRDVKPGNLLLTIDGVVKILDFGIAKLADADLTRPGEAPGTIRYMPPEQAAGSEVDARADLWSLGMVLQEMLAGTPDVPQQLQQLLGRLLRTRPDERPADAAAVARELANIGAGLSALSGRATLGQRVRSSLLRPSGIVAAAALMMLAGTAAWREFSTARSVVPLAADANDAGGVLPGVAVLPFRVTGADTDLWQEGIVDLLSFNVDGLGELRKIDPQSVLRAWARVANDGRAGIERAVPLEVGRLTGASFAVEGSVVRAGNDLRITASVYDVAAARLRGTVQVTGAADSALTLMDQLTLELVRRDLLPSGGDIPPVNIARLTTTSLAAAREYLAGERFYRRARWREAATHFQQAVEIDSTFARALFRLAGAYVWQDETALLTPEYMDRAARFAHRMPERDALLLRGTAGSDLSLLRRLTQKYPDDVDGWYRFGDGLFHTGGVHLEPAGAFRSALERAVSMTPNYAEAYVHLIEDAAIRQDSARARALIDTHESLDPARTPCPGYRIAFDIAWGDQQARTRAHAALASVDKENLRCAWVVLAVAPAAAERMDDLDRRPSQHDLAPLHRVRDFGRQLQPKLMRGQLEGVRRVITQADAVPFVNIDAARWTIILHLTGYPDDTAVRSAAGLLAKEPWPEDHFWLGALAVENARWDVVDRAVNDIAEQARNLTTDEPTIEALAGSENFRFQASFGTALQAYARYLRGSGSLQAFEQALATMQPVGWRGAMPGKLMRFRVGQHLFDQGRHADAERYFSSFYHYDWLHYVPAQLYLARIHEAAGRGVEARTHYARVVSWWRDSDPQFHAWRDEAVSALERLSGESRR